MIIDSFANRLSKALDMNNMKPIDLARKSGIDKSLISNYMSGRYKAKQDNLSKIAGILHVNEAWLMGYDISSQPTENKDESENIYVTTIYDDGESVMEIKSDKPFKELSEDEKANIIERAMDELYEFKRELKKEEK